jgi:hypothetical protein
MPAPDPRSPRQQYLEWVEDCIEDYKNTLTREELLAIAESAVDDLFDSDDGQYPLTEILLRDAVDTLIFQRLGLPGYRRWLKTCQTDTADRPLEGTPAPDSDGRRAS